jgi:hypothetical protein
MTSTPASWHRATACFVGALVQVGLVGAEVHAEGPIGPFLDLPDLLAQLVRRHRDGGQDPERTGGARGCGQPGTRHPPHARLYDRQVAAHELAEPGPERVGGGRRAHQSGTSV